MAQLNNDLSSEKQSILAEKYPYRIIKAVWSGKTGGSQFSAPIEIIGHDDIGIVNNITSLISKEKDIVLRSITVDSHDGLFQGRLVIGVNDLHELNNLLKKINNIKGIKHVQRIN